MANVEVVLLQRVDKLGQMGEVVKVKPGYARNFLLPQKKALRATKANLARFEEQRAQLEALPAEIGTYVNGAVLEQALISINGQFEDKTVLMKALRNVNVQTVRGPVAFDNYGNAVGDVYIRRVERLDNRLVNTVQYTYPNVSQFWDMKPEEFLKNPVYSRDYPPAKNLES